MRILLIGSGGRESAIARSLSLSPECEALFIAPGNAGTGEYGTNVALQPLDFEGIGAFVDAEGIDMVVVGPEAPLVDGIREYLEGREGRKPLIVGPGKAGAALEGSKDFAKEFMGRHGIPTARHLTVRRGEEGAGDAFLESLKPPYVLKADGLAAGKGVLIIDNIAEAKRELRDMLAGAFGAASAKVVIEEYLRGIECSVFVLTDGNGGYVVLPPAKDYKRIGEGDTGLNTGGMGAVCPPPFADTEFMAKVEDRVVLPTLAGLRAEGIDYRGFIFLGLMKTGNDPMVIEYNARMGDPETEAVMPRIVSDIVPLLAGAAGGNLGAAALEVDPRTAVTVMAVAGGYPGNYAKGTPMTIGTIPADSILFHAGTTTDSEGRTVTAGGRVIAATGLAGDVAHAAALSFEAIEAVDYEGKYYRRDIGKDVI